MADLLAPWDPTEEDPKDRDKAESVPVAVGFSDPLLAGLAPDAPPGHEAHFKVRLGNAHTSCPLANFVFRASDGEKISFQTTSKACGSLDACMHIARACYLEFERGASKEEVSLFRKEQYEISKAAIAAAAGQSISMSSSAHDISSQKAGTAVESKDPNEVCSGGTAVEVEPAIDPNQEDAPLSSMAHVKVKHYALQNLCRFDFVSADGEKVCFQVTIKSCNGSVEDCARICRLCYVKFEEGMTKSDILTYRNDLVSRLSTQPGLKRKLSATLSATEVMPKVKSERDEGPPIKHLATKAEPDMTVKLERAIDSSRDVSSKVVAQWDEVTADNGGRCFRLEHTGPEPPIDMYCTVRETGETCGKVARVCRLIHLTALASEDKPEAASFSERLNVLCAAYRSPHETNHAMKDEAIRRERKMEPEGKEAKKEKKKKKKDKDKGDSDSDKENTKVGTLTEDAPDGHFAHTAVKAKDKKGRTVAFFMKLKINGETIEAQATVAACNGSVADAQRIARLMYVKLEAGEPRDDVIRWRDEMYVKCGGGAINMSSVVRAKEAPSSRPIGGGSKSKFIETLRSENRLVGAVRVAGRDEARNAASINGTYVAVPEGFDRKRAYEKVDGSKKRFLFYSRKRSGWKISDSLEDKKPGFAWAPAPDGGSKPPAELPRGTLWHVFDGKDQGYPEDAEVHCTRLKGAPPSPQSAGVAPSVSARSTPPPSSSGSSSSDSESVEDSDNDSSVSSKSEAPGPAASPAPVPSPLAALAAVGADARKPGRRRPTGGRVCAKMLVAAGLRCACHFAYMQDCPAKPSRGDASR